MFLHIHTRCKLHHEHFRIPSPQKQPHAHSVTLPSPSPLTPTPLSGFYYSAVCVSGIIRDLWLASFTQLIRVAAHVRMPFLLTTELCSSEYVYILFNHLSKDGYLGCSHILAGVTSAATNMCTSLCRHTCLDYTPRSGIAGSHGDYLTILGASTVSTAPAPLHIHTTLQFSCPLGSPPSWWV